MNDSSKLIDSLPARRDLTNPATQDALKLTARQRAAVAQAVKKGEDAWRNEANQQPRDPRDGRRALTRQDDGGRGAAIQSYLDTVPLTTEQIRTLKRLPLKRAGARVVWEAGVSDALKLTSKQLDPLNDLFNTLSMQRYKENAPFGKKHHLTWHPGGKGGGEGWILSSLGKAKREFIEHWVASRDSHYEALKWKALAAALSAEQRRQLAELLGRNPLYLLGER